MEHIIEQRPYVDWPDSKINEGIRAYKSIAETYRNLLSDFPVDWPDCKIDEHIRVYRSFMDNYRNILRGFQEELLMRQKAKYEASK